MDRPRDRPSLPKDIRVLIENIENDGDENRNTHPVPPEKDPRMLEYDGEDIPIQAPNRMMRHIAHEVELMIQLADKMHESAEHVKLLLGASSLRGVNLDELERLTAGGVTAMLRDLRQETLHSLVDGQRASSRYDKVMHGLRNMRRRLRNANLGQWRSNSPSGGGGAGNGSGAGESIQANGDSSFYGGHFNTP